MLTILTRSVTAPSATKERKGAMWRVVSSHPLLRARSTCLELHATVWQAEMYRTGRVVRYASSVHTKRQARGKGQMAIENQHELSLRVTQGDAKRNASPPPPSSPPRSSTRQVIFRILAFLTWIPVGYMVVAHVGSIGAITGASMHPTINPTPNDKDLVLLNRFIVDRAWWRIKQMRLIKGFFSQDDLALQVGDVILFIAPFDPNRLTCKRVLALPGDCVLIDEPDGSKKRIRIPRHHVWVEGDVSSSKDPSSMRLSRDSRHYGPIHTSLIKSRVEMILWPPLRFGSLPARPGFDAERMRHLRELRRERAQIGLRGGTYAGRSHPDDSSLSPFVEWEWSSNGNARGRTGEQGKLFGIHRDTTGVSEAVERHLDEALRLSTTEDAKRKHKRREEKREEMRSVWNRSSRGGRLGDDAESEDGLNL